ncbi:uncharacterized protein LOC128954065 [Oppia nitens]|uniref:uncharacterized protein LOC128954065 n=1 Tax=Oppia nitens TaxID=1686743 RepID=UPI0023D9FFF6|nr:uncharacterized protein LOC128954065 [Oppia nitens]
MIIMKSKDELPKAIVDMGYSLQKEIGKGMYSTIFKVKNNDNKRQDLEDKQLVCKWIDVESAPKMWKQKCMKLELKVLKRVLHPFIVRTYDLIKTRNSVFIFMDYCPNGSVYQELHKQAKPFAESLAKRWFSNILGALAYCHSKGIAHRDIKLDNFLLNEDMDALLTDFSFATLAKTNKGELMKETMCGHPAYMAPEVFADTRFGPYDAKAADMYSMGVCLFEMLNFDKPFAVSTDAYNNQRAHVQRQRNREYRFHSKVGKRLSPPVIQLVDQLLDPNPNTRIRSDETLIHSGIVVYQ